ncbi:glutathione transferase GstA [Niveibacterium terrae]|uniref:glutathione transferase GstA n=1 Tax=Niveibacterium terrae TaxID=3373598 RepID=UPI003A9274C7
MKLYYAPGACSLASHIALAESGLAFSVEKVNLRETPHRTESGADFAAINPKGYVPALVLDDGELLTEGAAILQYVADQAPERGLAPANGTLARYRLQEWLNFIATEIHKSFGPMWNPQSSQEVKDATWAKLSARFDWIVGELGEQDYLLGAFSVADAYLFTCLNWTSFLKIPLTPWPALVAYQTRIAARAAVHQVLKDEGLLG